MSISVEIIDQGLRRAKSYRRNFIQRQSRCVGLPGAEWCRQVDHDEDIDGFIPQTSGKASVCGFDVETHPLEVKRRIGYLPESNPLYQDMYVRESLALIAGIHKINHPQKRINDIIEQTGLTPERHKKIGQLSKGYRQRVGLAQAILHDPQVLILDEPTTGLDPNQLIGIRQLIRELGKTKTIILSTHIMQEVEAVCSQVVIINKGKIVADDTLDGLRSKNKGKSLENIFIGLTNLG